jgi:hypothetical protein
MGRAARRRRRLPRCSAATLLHRRCRSFDRAPVGALACWLNVLVDHPTESVASSGVGKQISTAACTG